IHAASVTAGRENGNGESAKMMNEERCAMNKECRAARSSSILLIKRLWRLLQCLADCSRRLGNGLPAWPERGRAVQHFVGRDDPVRLHLITEDARVLDVPGDQILAKEIDPRPLVPRRIDRLLNE